MAVKQIPIRSLTLGMYVIKLDIAWIDSPFMYHHLLIKTQKQIDKLKNAGVKLVTIDTAKGKDVEGSAIGLHVEPLADAPSAKPAQTLDTTSPAKAPELPRRVPLDAEMGIAKALMGKMMQLSAQINASFENGEQIFADQVHPLIDETLSSLARNEHALTTLINMQHKDQSLVNHAFAVFSLVLSLSIKQNLSNDAQQMLGLAAFFHDVGWLKLPLNLLGKKSAYTPSESKLIQQHIALAQKTLLSQCDLPDLTMRIIAEHHECLDGSGYPKHLRATDLHPLSKLFTVVVRYDELIHGLNDKPALTPNGALALLFKEAKQGKLDDAAVLSLISLLSVYPVGSVVQLSSKEKARVIETNPEHPKQPKVKIYYDVAGVAHVQPKILDLAHQSLREPLEIMAVLDINDPKVDPARLLGMLE